MSEVEKLLAEAELYADDSWGAAHPQNAQPLVRRLVAVVRRQRQELEDLPLDATEDEPYRCARSIRDCLADCETLAKGEG